MPVARPESSDSRTRIIAHVDLDCFYVQVEQLTRLVKLGVSRHMRGDDAKEVCPQIHLVQVPVARGKADLNIYRNAGSEVVSILARKGRCERASIDEVYLDLTDSAEAMLRETPPESLESINEEARKSHILGLKSEDANDAQENASKWLRKAQFTCSAGVAHNKMLAKLVSGMNKPAQQTVVPSSSVKRLLESLPIKKMKQLGGKLGTSLQTDLGVNTVGDLLKFSEEKLQERFGINTGTWLWNIARGINGEEVQGRLLPKSHGAGKSFPGPRALKTIASVQHWLNQLCDELNERICFDLDQNKRIAHTLTVYASAYKVHLESKTLGHHHNGWGITSLSVSASKIVAIPSGTGSITKYFHGQYTSPSSKETQDTFVKKTMPLSPLGSESYSELEPTDQLQPDNNVPCVGIPWKEQDSSCSSTVQTKDGSGKGASPPLPSGSGCCSPVNQTNSASRVDSTMPTLERHKKKIKPSDKGTILKFLKSYNLSCPTPNQENVEMVKGSQPPSCSSSLEENQAELPGRSLAESRSNDGSYNLDQNAQRAWNYKIDEIDHSIVDELPSEIQDEIRVWLQARQQPGMVKRPSMIKRGSIAHYFSPARNT
ncbi:DNA polymerase ETA [Salix purpurea]|uniref:DNA polymerase eta n=1 Tax=Salix purpurea TaxID=77065 RepID=A0A9Q0T8V2_SALPP|nr:DNA polymerase ETA [Salix purpurea]